ncbi:Lachesin [Nymphon striatum]|nr:Lachesin [Nymphon striatum]
MHQLQIKEVDLGGLKKVMEMNEMFSARIARLCQQNPIITSISQDKIVDVGKTVSLSCSVQFAQKYPVLWIKKRAENDLFISQMGTIIFPDQRYSLRHDSESNTYTLQIQDVTQTDNGVYQCRIQIGQTTEVTAEVDLAVRIQPTISDNSTGYVLKSEGADVVELFCHASGMPQPKITWRRENNKVLPSGGAVHKGNSLKIHNIRKEDRGTYFCIADNGVGAGDSRNIRVDVEFQPVIRVQRLKVGQALKYDMDLQCTVEAYPSPSIQWYKDNTQLVNDQHYGLTNFATTDQTTDSTLRVISIQKSQYGDFECYAENKLGSATAKIRLFETSVPSCPPACDITTLSHANSKQASIKIISLFTAFSLVLRSMYSILQMRNLYHVKDKVMALKKLNSDSFIKMAKINLIDIFLITKMETIL